MPTPPSERLKVLLFGSIIFSMMPPAAWAYRADAVMEYGIDRIGNLELLN